MSVPCPNTQPHRPHLDDGPDGMCPGRPTVEALAEAERMVCEAWERATERCLGSRRPCVNCVGGQLLNLSVFEPVLFPKEEK